MSTIDDVKERLDIVETVSSYVPDLKKSGRTFKALCPFHSERTPSFTVDPDRGTWHCFGACSTGGDVIEFVRRIEGLDFREALSRCAERAGVELRPPSPREQEQRETHDRLLRANETAAVFFQAALTGPEGQAASRYLSQRGLDAETIQTWQLGYAPEEWRGLLDHLLARGFSEPDVLEAGLAVEGDRGVYDRFRHRLLFPIRDARGRLTGFGARALPREGQPEDDPKYLNTPRTPLFDKSGTLYGLDRAAEPARRADRMVIVEGYMDVIAAHQFGIANVVASMGTAVTTQQMEHVKRLTANIVLALDADAAGSEATLRAVEVAAGAAAREAVPTIDWRGLIAYQDVLQSDIRVAALPEGEDPDTLVRAGPDRFRALIEGAKAVADHLLDVVTVATDPEDARSRSRALETLAPTVAAMTDPVVRAHYVQRLARIGRVDERTVAALIARHAPGRAPEPVPSPAEARRAVRSDAQAPDGEAQLLLLLLHRPECRDVRDSIDADTFEDSTNRRLFEAWRDRDHPGDGDWDDEDGDGGALEEDVRERLRALREQRPEWLDPRYLESGKASGMATAIAGRLRLDRARSRLAPAAAEQAAQVAEARHASHAGQHTGQEGGDGEAEGAEVLVAELAELTARQRDLSRAYREQAGHQPARRVAEAAGDGNGEGETADDAGI